MTTLDKFGRAFMRYPDSQWQKLLFKAPLILWRLGLGPIMGHHVLVITTVGRKTGLPRHTMTEYHTMEGRIYIPCAVEPRPTGIRICRPTRMSPSRHGKRLSL